mmetsp:Transcript_63503/g.72775  ORF Transcript_63503/g.72775 Transcript_63503/m.72775 type:complete len:508 (+) Transcript_63503:151-1674(+)
MEVHNNEKIVLYYSNFNLNTKEWLTEIFDTDVFKNKLIALSEPEISSFSQTQKYTETQVAALGKKLATAWIQCKKEREVFPEDEFCTICVDVCCITHRGVNSKQFREVARIFNRKSTLIYNSELDMLKRPATPTNPRKRQLSEYLPGYNFVKKRVLEPLIVAKELVVEYIQPETKSDIQSNGERQSRKRQVTSPEDNADLIADQIADMDLNQSSRDSSRNRNNSNDKGQRKTRTVFRKLSKVKTSGENPIISRETIESAADYMGQVSEKMKANFQVTKNFVTNIVEVNNQAIGQLGQAVQRNQTAIQNELNIRFIEPARKYYSSAVEQFVCMMESAQNNRVTCSEFAERMKATLGNTWHEKLRNPTFSFFQTAQVEYQELMEEDEDISIPRFLERVKQTLFESWQESIVKKSSMFSEKTKEDVKSESDPTDKIFDQHKSEMNSKRNKSPSGGAASLREQAMLSEKLLSRLRCECNSTPTSTAVSEHMESDHAQTNEFEDITEVDMQK